MKIKETPVGYTNSYLYLGIDIDSSLTFKQYYGNMFRKISYKLFLLRRIRYMVTYKAALDITKTMFCSIIDYGNIFLSSCNEGELYDVQILQNHALRCCCNVKNQIEVHIPDLHKSTNVLMVEIRRKQQILTCIWRNINKGTITLAKPKTRHNIAPTIYLPVPKTELFKKSVYYYCATLWNALPPEIRLCDNIEEFKNKVHKIIV